MPWLRKSIFFVFLAVYLITCPLLILYVLGYVMRPGTAQGMMRTGLISLATAPSGASIYVGGRRYLRRTPAVLDGLAPGEYDLKVILKHYHPWVRTVEVEGEKATVLEKIVLVPTHPAARVLLSGPTKELTPVPETRFVVLSTGPKIEDLVVYNRDAAEPRPLIPLDSPFRGSRVLSSVVVNESPFLLLRLRAEEGEAYLSVSLKSGEVRQADLLTLFPGKPQEVTWEPRRPYQLFSVQDGSVHRIDLEAMAVSPSIAERVRGFGIHDQRLYVLTEDGLLQRRDPDGGRIDTLFQDPLPGGGPARASGFFRITVPADDLIIVLGDRGELWVSRFPDRWIDTGVRGVEFDPRGERLLIWRKDRVGVLDCAGQDPNPLWMAEGGNDIRQAFWVYEASHVLFQDGPAIFLLEREPAASPAPASLLLRVRAGSAVAYAEEVGGLYYLDRESQALSFLEVIPRP